MPTEYRKIKHFCNHKKNFMVRKINPSLQFKKIAVVRLFNGFCFRSLLFCFSTLRFLHFSTQRHKKPFFKIHSFSTLRLKSNLYSGLYSGYLNYFATHCQYFLRGVQVINGASTSWNCVLKSKQKFLTKR